VSQTPPASGVETLGVYVASCSKVLWQWRFSGVGTAEYPVKGFQYVFIIQISHKAQLTDLLLRSLFSLNRKNQITQVEFEFNSVAWGQDTYQLPCGTDDEPTGTESASGPEPSSAAPRL
jgi:hypothetical protein